MIEPHNMPTASETDECGSDCSCHVGAGRITRRDFLLTTTLAASGVAMSMQSAVAGPFQKSDFQTLIPEDMKLSAEWIRSLTARGTPTVYRGAELKTIGMPVGGIGCGQLYLGGDGKLWHWDLFNLPQPGNFSDSGGPNYARPPHPESPIEQGFAVKVTVDGKSETRQLDSRGFRAETIGFQGQYPVAHVDYNDSHFPVSVTLTAFSPFIPLNVEDSSLPATLLRFTVKNTGTKAATVELAGWLENAVCLGSGRAEAGHRRNQILRHADFTLLHGTAQAAPPRPALIRREDVLFEDFESG